MSTDASPADTPTADAVPLDEILVTERELWLDGPPHETFERLRGECPVHWTSHFTEYPGEPGFWSVTTQDDIHTVSRDWRRTPRSSAGSPRSATRSCRSS